MIETTLAQNVKRIAELRAELLAHREASSRREREITNEMNECAKRLSLLNAGLDTQKVAIARAVIDVGDYSRRGEDGNGARLDAIDEIAKGGGRLWAETFGVKNYAHWCGQRSDHTYGYCPKHGSVVFGIGLLRTVRLRNPQTLTDAEIEAALYLLINLEQIQSLERSAA